jgi:hypothetical protein
MTNQETNPDGTPVASFDYGHQLDRDERSAELYRIGGLMDSVDAWTITAAALTELGDVDKASADQLARAIFARLAQAEGGPILPCRLTEVEQPTPAPERVPTPREFPEEGFLSKTIGEWPLTFDTSESSVAQLLQASSRGRAWRVRVEYLEEMELVPPTPAGIRVKGGE